MFKPNWYYGWNVIAITLLFQSLTIGIHYYCFTLWVVPWSAELGAVRGNIMVAITASLVISGAISPLAGRALDRLPSHWLVCGGAVIYAVGLLCIAAAQAVWQIILVYMLILPIGLVLTGAMAAQTLATRWFTKDRGFAIASSTLGTSVGGFTFPPIAAALLTLVGWRLTFVILAAVAVLLITPLAWRVLKQKPPDDEEEIVAAPEPGALPLSGQQQSWTTLALLRNRNFRVLVLCFLPMSLAFSALQMNMGAYAHDIGISQQQAAFLVSLLSIFMLAGKVLFGRLADNFDDRFLYWGVAAGMAAAIVVISAASSYAVLAVGAAILGFAYAGYLPLVGSIIVSRFGNRAFGQAMGLSSTFLSLGAAGSFIAGWIRDHSGSYSIAFLAFLTVILPAALLMRKLEPPRQYARRAS
jgi:MFS family permease